MSIENEEACRAAFSNEVKIRCRRTGQQITQFTLSGQDINKVQSSQRVASKHLNL